MSPAQNIYRTFKGRRIAFGDSKRSHRRIWTLLASLSALTGIGLGFGSVLPIHSQFGTYGDQGDVPRSPLSPSMALTDSGGPVGVTLASWHEASSGPAVPFVAYTLVLFNNSLIGGNFIVDAGWVPYGVAYDSGKGEIFVVYQVVSDLTVISDATNTIMASVAGAGQASAIVYDSGKGEVFLADARSDRVFVISDATNELVASISVGQVPSGLAYDGTKGEVFVSNFQSGNVSVISDSTNAVVATIPVGSGPLGAAYDSGRGDAFVTNFNSGTVSVISDTSNTVVATIAVGSYPVGATYDGSKGEVFVANAGTDNVSVISDATNRVLDSTPVGIGPWSMAYDSGNGCIYLSNLGGGTISIISPGSDCSGPRSTTGGFLGLTLVQSIVLTGVIVGAIAVVVVIGLLPRRRRRRSEVTLSQREQPGQIEASRDLARAPDPTVPGTGPPRRKIPHLIRP